MKCYNGEKKTFSLRRMRCVRCKRLHIELPDILVPNKHYAAELIENVVDGVSTPDDLSTENYPCERTMQRRKDWILKNRQQIDGYLKSICTRVSASGSESSSIMKPVSWIKADASAFKATVRRNPAITVNRIYDSLGTAEQVNSGTKCLGSNSQNGMRYHYYITNL